MDDHGSCRCACAEYSRQAALRHGALRGQLRVLVAEWRQRARGDHFTRSGGYTAAAGGVEDALTADGQWRMPGDPQ
jgi:hypothetical protein